MRAGLTTLAVLVVAGGHGLVMGRRVKFGSDVPVLTIVVLIVDYYYSIIVSIHSPVASSSHQARDDVFMFLRFSVFSFS